MELEWEKAARGADGRFFPWGDHFEHSWCATRRSWPSAGELSLLSGSFPADESPYGVRDMAGGIRDWAGDAMNTEPSIHDERVPVALAPATSEFINVRGGAFDFHSWRCAYRNGSARLSCSANIGFRLVRPLS